MSQGNKKPLVQLCLAFQVQSPPIGVACYGAAPGRGVGGRGAIGWESPTCSHWLCSERACWGWSVHGWPTHSLAGLGQSPAAEGSHYGLERVTLGPAKLPPAHRAQCLKRHHRSSSPWAKICLLWPVCQCLVRVTLVQQVGVAPKGGTAPACC